MKKPNLHSPLANARGNTVELFSERSISVSTHLDIEIDMIAFHLVTKGDSAIISFDSISDAFSILRKMKSSSILRSANINALKRLLSSMGLTVYLQNHHFGLFGPKAGVFVPKLIGLFSGVGRK